MMSNVRISKPVKRKLHWYAVDENGFQASQCGRYVSEANWYCGERGGDGVNGYDLWRVRRTRGGYVKGGYIRLGTFPTRTESKQAAVEDLKFKENL